MTPSDTKAAGRALGLLAPHRIAFMEVALDAVRDTSGEVWECGVYRGGSALYLKGHLDAQGSTKTLRLFDTFSGHPARSEWDTHPIGLFGDTSEAEVRARFEGLTNVAFHPGVIPASFAGLESATIAFAHIDVDQYQAVLDCLAFVYPRMVAGGYVLLDDYGCSECPGARRAVDEFMVGKPETLTPIGGPQVHFRKTPSL